MYKKESQKHTVSQNAFFGEPKLFDVFRYAKKKTCGFKYTSLSKFFHRSIFFLVYKVIQKNPEK